MVVYVILLLNEGGDGMTCQTLYNQTGDCPLGYEYNPDYVNDELSDGDPYPECIDDECTDQKFKNREHTAFNRTIKAVYAWGNEGCTHQNLLEHLDDSDVMGKYKRKRDCNICWESLN